MKIYNKAKDKFIPSDAVYVGRPTIWGNPYSHLNSGTLAKYKVQTRELAISSYETWINSNPDLIERAKRELKGKSLVCWCAPLGCHAEILMKIANE